jgi:hypothetical protein
MDKLPQVLQKEIWEYVRGDREYWKIQHDIMVLGLRCDNHEAAAAFWSNRTPGNFTVDWGQMGDNKWTVSISKYFSIDQYWEMIARYPPVSSCEICVERVNRLISQL